MAAACAASPSPPSPTITVAFALVFFYAPLDADQGFVQKIFYVHVPLAIISLCGFVFGGVLGGMYLRTGDRKWDIRSYVAIHMALIFGVGDADHRLRSGPRPPGATGGSGATRRSSSFLIVMLLFATYQPLRFSIEDPERQARYASVFAVVAGAFVPLNFIAVRAAQAVRPPARADAGRRQPARPDAAHVPDRAARVWRCCT